MPSEVSHITEGVKTALNSAPNGTFSMSFTAVRKYDPQADQSADLKTVLVTVFAQKQDSARLDRAGSQLKTLDIGIAIQKQIVGNPSTATANTEIDALDQFAEEIEGYFTPAISPGSGSVFENSNRAVLADVEALRKGMYLSVVTVTFKRT